MSIILKNCDSMGTLQIQVRFYVVSLYPDLPRIFNSFLFGHFEQANFTEA